MALDIFFSIASIAVYSKNCSTLFHRRRCETTAVLWFVFSFLFNFFLVENVSIFLLGKLNLQLTDRRTFSTPKTKLFDIFLFLLTFCFISSYVASIILAQLLSFTHLTILSSPSLRQWKDKLWFRHAPLKYLFSFFLPEKKLFFRDAPRSFSIFLLNKKYFFLALNCEKSTHNKLFCFFYHRRLFARNKLPLLLLRSPRTFKSSRSSSESVSNFKELFYTLSRLTETSFFWTNKVRAKLSDKQFFL